MDIQPATTPASPPPVSGSVPQPGDTSPADDPFVAMLAALLASTMPMPASEVAASTAGSTNLAAAGSTMPPAGPGLPTDGTNQSCAPSPTDTAATPAMLPGAIPGDGAGAGLAPPATGPRREAPPQSGRADAKSKDERNSISLGSRRSGKSDTLEVAPSVSAFVGPHSGPAACANGSSAQPELQPITPSSHMAGSAENALPNALVPVETTAGRANAATQAPVASPGQQAQVGQPTPLLLADHLGRPVTARLVVVGPGDHQRLRIALDPADLGRVEVDLRLDHGGTAAAVFTVDRAETLLLLQRDARAVTDMLTAAGFTVDQGDLGFTLRDNGGGGARPQTSPEEPAPRTRRHEDGALQALPPPIWVSRGLLDLHV